MATSISPNCTSSSNSFCWPISLEKWNKVAEGESIHLLFSSVTPTDGKMIQWRLDVYPKGFQEKKDGTRKIEVCLCSDDLEDNYPGYKLGKFQIETAYRIRHKDCNWPFDMPNSRSFLSFHSKEFVEFSSNWLSESYKVGTVEERAADGILTFEFEMRTFSAPRIKFKFSGSKEEIVNNFLTLSPDEGEVKLVCDAKQFGCHKFLLTSQSPVFRAMFRMNSIENQKSVVDIVDSNPEAVEELVFYLYKGSLRRTDNPVELIFGLMHLANKYQMGLMMNECLDVLMDIMDVDNVLKIFAVIDKLDHLGPYYVNDLIIDFMKKNIKKIVDKEDWSAFLSDHPSLVKDFVLNIDQELNALKDSKDM